MHTGANLNEFRKLSDMVMERQNSLLGHMIRHGDDMMSEVTLTADEHGHADRVVEYEVPYRRVGRPRQKWVETNCRYYWEHNEHDPFEYNQEQTNRIRDQAMNRKF